MVLKDADYDAHLSAPYICHRHRHRLTQYSGILSPHVYSIQHTYYT